MRDGRLQNELQNTRKVSVCGCSVMKEARVLFNDTFSCEGYIASVVDEWVCSIGEMGTTGANRSALKITSPTTDLTCTAWNLTLNSAVDLTCWDAVWSVDIDERFGLPFYFLLQGLRPYPQSYPRRQLYSSSISLYICLPAVCRILTAGPWTLLPPRSTNIRVEEHAVTVCVP
jgi:hypothetical protein